mmetsp:Transcript_11267/g.17762  ORF Transcript_11267/g.17762 Transcript_11267/m.17762 type:complete len:201 (+) Transcript_11267:126-728(+)|eukprot:CAMPEP_0117028242 /NCGR_PEP_ID=MMETSP0472-20121206/20551_1 /TAXON_ID=693140 ORGANISM="Tiarina fusus, Strain LIS" /NCGR_SAMPLE_ID=MMETSP0472 /ASSEMBLY_ACC=CAM_ASM_000603 /LENGTH=200 /DNA_ID=CAMNT_0004735673 /DNA_START=126 /DNA_END=728 /DNA_ORIENTATION=+
MNLEDFNDPDFEMGGPMPAMSDIPDRPLSQMFAEPLHVDGGGGASDFGGFDSNFDSDFGGFDSGFDNGFSGLDSNFGAMSTASLPPLNTIPSMGDSMDSGFGSSSGFGSRAAPPPSSQAPVFVGSNEGFLPGGNSKVTALACCCMYLVLILLLAIIIALCAVITYYVIKIDEDLNHLQLVITVPTNAPPPSLPPQVGLTN